MAIVFKWENMSSGAAFMFSLALADFLGVFYDGIIDELLPLFGFTLRLLNSALCAVCQYINYLTTFASYYITVLFSLDKCIAVMFPFKYREFGKPKACIISSILVYLCAGGIYSTELFAFRLDPVTLACRPIEFAIMNRYFFFKIRPQMSFIIGGVIPTFAVLLFTFITIFKVHQIGRKRAAQKNDATKSTLLSRRDAEITRQMIVVCLMFGALNLSISAILRVHTSLGMNSNRQTWYDKAQSFLCIKSKRTERPKIWNSFW